MDKQLEKEKLNDYMNQLTDIISKKNSKSILKRICLELAEMNYLKRFELELL